MPLSTKTARGAVISHLKNDATVTALQPASRIFPQEVPAGVVWPYSFTGATIDTPTRASCMNGRSVRLAVHTYAKGESAASDISDAIATSLDNLHLIIGDGYADIQWISNNVIRDPSEASAFHGVCQIQIDMVG